MMLAFGFSINLLTLLALVLAIGLVVDDAIIVVESVNHHMEEGMTALQAAFASARQLANPIIAMTVVSGGGLCAHRLPGWPHRCAVHRVRLHPRGRGHHLRGGGADSHPMMSARMLKPVDHAGGDLESPHGAGGGPRDGCRGRRPITRSLTGALNYLPVIAVFAGLVLCTSIGSTVPPRASWRRKRTRASSWPRASPPQCDASAEAALQSADVRDFAKHPETETVFQVESPSTSIAGWLLKPWDQRKATTKTLQPMIQQELNQVAGQKIVAFQQSPLPGSNGLPMQIVIGTSDGSTS